MTDRHSDDHLEHAETLVTPAAGTSASTASPPQGGDAGGPAAAGGPPTERRAAPTADGAHIHFGRFVTEGIIGRGGMGIVYRAVDPVIGRPVAIKALRTDHGASADSTDELQSRFELEFKSAGTLSHPNIVTIYDVGAENDTTFIAMEFIEGRSLEQLLREGDVLSFERIGELARGICAGLDYAHEAGIVHRDVKPANILIDSAKGRPKITDFGVAKVQSSGLTQTGTVIGTPAYMSPEQILGNAVSGRSDQFSAAVILYQMLTGKLPFGSDAPASILFRIVHNEPTPPHEINPDLPETVSAALARAMAKDPLDRFASCEEMAIAVHRALLGEAPPPAPERDHDSFKSVTLSTTEPLRGSGTYSGAASWWQRRSGAPRVGLGLLGTLLFAALGWVAVATFLDREIIPPNMPFADRLAFLQRDAVTPPDGEPEGATDGAETAAAAAPETSTIDTPVAGEPGPQAPPALPRPVTIRSQPAGATVTLDDAELPGVTPLEVELEPGRAHRIQLALDGYRPGGGTVEDAAALESDELFYPLQRDVDPGRIALSPGEGYGALVVEIGGRRVDPGSVAPGRHQVTVRSPSNYLEVTRELEVPEGGPVAFELPELRRVRIISVVQGTATIDDGAELQLPADVWMAPGTQHGFTFAFEDGTVKERRLMIGRNVAQIVGSPSEIVTRSGN